MKLAKEILEAYKRDLFYRLNAILSLNLSGFESELNQLRQDLAKVLRAIEELQ